MKTPALALTIGLLAPLPLLGQGGGGGPLDTGFGPNQGHFRLNRDTHSEDALDLAVDSQGRILVAFLYPDAGTPGVDWPALVRLTPEGFLDPTFGLLGLWVESTLPAVAVAAVAVAVDGSDRPLVGWTYEFDQGGTPNRDWALRRLTASGMPDLFKVAAFDLGIGGSGDRFDHLSDLLVWWDGRVIGVGEAQYGGQDWDFAAAVWMPDGADGLTLDPSFSGDGRATVPFDLGGFKTDRVEAVVAHGTGFVLVGWAATATPGTEMAVCRFDLLSGALDTSFGTGGKATYFHQPLGDAPWAYQWAHGAAALGDGLILAGTARGSGPNSRFALLRIDDVGAVDASWGVFGWIVPDLRYPGLPFESAWAYAFDVVADGESRVLAVGQIEHPTLPSQSRGVALRLTPQGVLDSSFSGDGVETYGLEPAGQPNQNDFFRVELVEEGTLAVAAGATRGVTGGVARSDLDVVVARVIVDPLIFADDFETGNLSAWVP